MLKDGIKVSLEMTRDDARAELMVGIFGRVVSLDVDLKRWRMDFKKKSYSVMVGVGPLTVRVVSLDKMGKFIDSVLKENEDKLHSEM